VFRGRRTGRGFVEAIKPSQLNRSFAIVKVSSGRAFLLYNSRSFASPLYSCVLKEYASRQRGKTLLCFVVAVLQFGEVVID